MTMKVAPSITHGCYNREQVPEVNLGHYIQWAVTIKRLLLFSVYGILHRMDMLFSVYRSVTNRLLLHPCVYSTLFVIIIQRGVVVCICCM